MYEPFDGGRRGEKTLNSVLHCPKKYFYKHSNRQLEPALTLNFPYRIFRHSALAPNFAIDPIFASEIWAPWCTPVTVAKRQHLTVSVTFHPELVAEIWKCGSRRLNLPFLVLQPSILSYCRRRSRSSSYSFWRNRLSCSPLRRHLRHAPHNSFFSLWCPRWHLVPCYCSSYYSVLG